MNSPSLDTDADAVMTCQACGASIYQEHIDRGLAGMWAGEMLCPTCRRERQGVSAGPPEAAAISQLDNLPLRIEDEDIEAGEEASADAGGSGIAGLVAPDGQPRKPSAASSVCGARHVRTFHAKLSEGAIRHLDEQINAWLARHPEIDIKFANTTVGVWEAKHAEPNLIVTVFY